MRSQQRNGVLSVAALVTITGLSWLYAAYLLSAEDEFGFQLPHPLQHWSLVAHGVTSFAALWGFGMLWSQHVLTGWRARRKRITGGVLFGCVAWLAISGCALYYLGSEQWRSWTSLAHWTVGLVAVSMFIAHYLARWR